MYVVVCVCVCVGYEALLGVGLSSPAHFLWDRVFIDQLCCTGWPASSEHPLQPFPSQYWGSKSVPPQNPVFSESCCSNHPASLPISKNAASSSIFFLLSILIRHSWNHFHQGHPRFCWLNLANPHFPSFLFVCTGNGARACACRTELCHAAAPRVCQAPPCDSHFFLLVPSFWGAWGQPGSPGRWGGPCLCLKRTMEHLPRGSLEVLHAKGDQPLQRTHSEELKGAEYRAV